MKNQHINDFLDYYINLTSPQYAVMIKGLWGSGKTFFIEEYKKSLDIANQKYIYVSLYGVQNYDEIETKFFEKLHPMLSNRKTIIAGKIAKGLLKATLKIDLDNDGEADGSVGGQLPDLEKNDLLNTEDYILIFDDLERCSIPVNDVLGYINYFVEHQDYKVIIIANENELDKNNQEYKSIKEKLIGKTFELTSNSDIAYDSFVANLKQENQMLFQEYKKDIIMIYNQSNYNNLRLLRQTILDFERFWELILKEEHREKKDLIKDTLKLYFIFSFENKYDSYDIFHIGNLYDTYLTSLYNKKEDEETDYQKLTKKYNLDLFGNSIFDISVWEKIIDKSLIEKDMLNNLLKSSKYYIDENSPNWRKLWNFRSLDDENFNQVLTLVEDELKNSKLTSVVEVRQVNSILINLNIYGLYKEKKSTILRYSKQHIDYLYENDLIDKSIYENDNLIINDPFNGTGLGYFDENNPHCKKFIDYLSSTLKKGKENFIKKEANSVIELLGSDFDKIYDLFSSYSHKAFLHYVDIPKIVDTLNEIDNDTLLNFGRILSERYDSSYKRKELKVEIDFLNKLKKSLKKEQKKHKGTLKGFSFDTFIKYALNKGIDTIDTENKRGKRK